MKVISFYISLVFILLFTACTDSDLEPTLSNDKDIAIGINNIEDLQGLANGMHDRLTLTTYYGRNMQIYGEVRSDNCFANGNSGRFVPEAQMTVNPDNSNGPWEAMYAVIASANIIIQQDLNLHFRRCSKTKSDCRTSLYCAGNGSFRPFAFVRPATCRRKLWEYHTLKVTAQGKLTPARETVEEKRKGHFRGY
jgi:hypothetical protein